MLAEWTPENLTALVTAVGSALTALGALVWAIRGKRAGDAAQATADCVDRKTDTNTTLIVAAADGHAATREALNETLAAAPAAAEQVRQAVNSNDTPNVQMPAGAEWRNPL